MIKTLYLVRHCKSTGQLPDAPLSPQGNAQAIALADLLADEPIDRILSSPYLRARQSAQPLADRLNLPLELDERFGERVLSSTDRPDWLEQLRASFDDYELSLPGGESNRTVQARGVAALSDALADAARTTVVVNHGTIMTLMLNYFTEQFGFNEWQKLTNPDVYRIEIRANVMLAWRNSLLDSQGVGWDKTFLESDVAVKRIDGVDAVSAATV